MQRECSGGVGEGTSMCCFKSVPTWWFRGLMHARHATLTPVSASAIVLMLLSMFSGEIYMRLKPYLVVKISSDIMTEHCCAFCLCILHSYAFCLWCFANLAAGCVLACVVRDCAIKKLLEVSCCLISLWQANVKNILYIWFSHFSLTETHQC